jgi:hypothetical protein
MRKYTVFAIFAFLLITPVAIQSVHATSATDSWYPGKGSSKVTILLIMYAGQTGITVLHSR